MLPKGQVKISIANATRKRLEHVKDKLIREHPEKYDEDTSLHRIIVWILDENKYL